MSETFPTNTKPEEEISDQHIQAALDAISHFVLMSRTEEERDAIRARAYKMLEKAGRARVRAMIERDPGREKFQALRRA